LSSMGNAERSHENMKAGNTPLIGGRRVRRGKKKRILDRRNVFAGEEGPTPGLLQSQKKEGIALVEGNELDRKLKRIHTKEATSPGNTRGKKKNISGGEGGRSLNCQRAVAMEANWLRKGGVR